MTLRVDIPDEELRVRGDPDRLRQVFVNLLSNAVKFTANGEVSMRVRKDDGTVSVEVIDSGMGITSDFLPYVFEPFRRGDRARATPASASVWPFPGDSSNPRGTIHADSDGANRGSTFTVRLPLA